MKNLVNYTIQLSLFIVFGAAYAQLASSYVPLYIFSEDVRETLFLLFAAISSLLSVQLLKNVFGLTNTK
ncbi:MAG: hypothetical protein KBT36_05385 [Kurthia sp.]|nr:hypothetical protein [Candidatus Kurthia equi]